MALAPRHRRVVLGKALLEFLQTPKLNSAARVAEGRKGCACVLTIGSSQDREFRTTELDLGCLVVRARLPNCKTVVGIATDRLGTSTIGYSSDIVYRRMPQWTTEDERRVRGIQDELGYFRNASWSATRASGFATPRDKEGRRDWRMEGIIATTETTRAIATRATGPGGALGAPVPGSALTVAVGDCVLRAKVLGTAPSAGVAAIARNAEVPGIAQSVRACQQRYIKAFGPKAGGIVILRVRGAVTLSRFFSDPEVQHRT